MLRVSNDQATTSEFRAAEVFNATGTAPLVLICEHASRIVPPTFGTLGLSETALHSHIAWDPGALALAKLLATRLDAALVFGTVSRLVYDCNRPPEAPDAMPTESEATRIPGNEGLSTADRAARVAAYYQPFHDVVDRVVTTRTRPAIVTIHSFTPTYLGQPRGVEIGILHDSDTALADGLLTVASGYRTARNEPYGPADGVTHTLQRHAIARGLPNAMIEVRNDLLATDADCAKVAGDLSRWLHATLPGLTAARVEEPAP
ncbi:MAG: N-formylglutamate amidohydrolase [Pseudomonadota bacterium]